MDPRYQTLAIEYAEALAKYTFHRESHRRTASIEHTLASNAAYERMMDIHNELRSMVVTLATQELQ